MNQFYTMFQNLSKMDGGEIKKLSKADLNSIKNLAAVVIKDDISPDEIRLVTSWANDNRPAAPYIDFYFALRPYWLKGTPDDKQIKMCVTINTETRGEWWVKLVMDCVDGEIESWGEAEFKPNDLLPLTKCIRHMINPIQDQYLKQLNEENAKQNNDLKAVAEIVKSLIEPHADEIKRICKEHNITLYADHNIEGSNCFRALPNYIEPGELEDGQEEIPEDAIPFIDFGALSFDSSYDFFRKVK